MTTKVFYFEFVSTRKGYYVEVGWATASDLWQVIQV